MVVGKLSIAPAISFVSALHRRSFSALFSMSLLLSLVARGRVKVGQGHFKKWPISSGKTNRI